MQRTRTSSLPRLLARTGLALGLAVAGQAVLMPSAFAATLTVTSTADVATNFGACGNSAQTTSSGSLREAVCAANNVGAGSSTITVAAGTYTLTNGELQMGKVSGSNITLAGAGAGSTIISGNNAHRVIEFDPGSVGGVTTSISGVTITDGNDSTFGGAGIAAGAVTSIPADNLTVSNSTITNNHATGNGKAGGGLGFSGGHLTITNSTISNNSTTDANGSGVWYRAEGVTSGEGLTISGTTFSGNNVNANTVQVGGALEVQSVRSIPATFDVSNSRFTGNTVTGSGAGIPRGGAIDAPGGTLNVTESTFTGNSVAGGSGPAGGAISVTGATANLHYNRFTGNSAPSGSAVYASAGSVNATDNWWGCNTGPGTAGCDAVTATATGTATVSPRLVLTATASPATVVGPNATSTITATLTQNSLGSAIGASNLDAFAGLPVSFTDPQPSGATIGAASVNLSSGSASTTYNSQNSSGPGHVLATLDNGTATATVTVNRPPAITSGNTVTFTAGTAGTFTVTTTGYPAPALTETGTVPPGMTFHDNGNGTATLSGTPTAGGSYPLSLTANNGVAPNATQTLTVTVNQPPAFTSANTATFTAGTAGSFSITTTPTAYPTPPTITKTGTLPTGLTFTDNGNGTATLAGTPAAGTGGTYSLSLKATNGINPDGTQTLTVNVNEAPAITTNPSDQTVNSGASASFTAAASGFPAPTVQWQRSTDGGTTFTNIAGATNPTYTFTAASADNGNKYRAVFTNSTGTATSTAATLTVHTAPTITSANTTSFAVGTAGTFTVATTGFPKPTLTTTGTLPAWLSFTDNGDGTATLSGTAPAGSGGQYSFTIKASNGTAPDASQAFTLTVNESPTITSADHTTFEVGTAGTFTVTTTPGFPTATTITKTGTLPTGVSFTDNGNGTATLAGTPAAGTAGSYPITVKASNGASPDATQSFTLTVTEAPAFTSADHTTFVVGSAGTFTVTTSPAAVTVTETGPLPSGVSFTDNGDGTATLAGTPAAGTGGAYTVTLTATNASGSSTQSFTLSVNELASFTSADHTTFAVGTAGTFSVTTLPGFPTTTTITKTGTLPSGVTFTDNGDGTATLAGTPAAGTAGSYPLTITAMNGAGNRQQSFTLTVTEAPAITSADHTIFTVGSAGTFTVTTSPTADTVTETGTLPSGVTFTDNGDGTATLAGTPAAGTGGVYNLSFKATNGTGFTTQSFTLMVYEKASITSADHTTFVVGSAGNFTVTTTAGYPVATTITKTGALPSGVTFTDNGDGTATIGGTPAAGTAGSYPLTIDATNAAGTSSQSFTLTVTPASASPVITSADHTTFAFGSAGTFTVTTTPGFPVTTTITETGALPAGVTFTDNGDGTATIAGTATATGDFPITITASNGASTDATQNFTLTVTKKPAISSADHTTFTVGSAGTFTVTTTPGYPTATTLSSSGTLPSGVSFTDNGDGTATLAGTPAAGTAGSYPLTITASNTAGSTNQAFTLTVTPASASPVITSADHTTFAFGAAGTFTVTTTPGYPAATTITKTGSLPAGVTFTDNHDGTATIAGTPTTAGAFTITITASNGASTDATQSFTLTVTKVPAITSADHTTFTIGTAGTFTVTTTAGYPAATTLSSTGTLPSGVSFTDNGNGTATLSGTPAAGTNGSYPLTITASNSAGSTQQSFTLTVQQANASPVITSADHATFTKGSAGSFTVTTTAGYPTATTITETGTLPAGVTFTDNHNGTATIAGTPTVAGAFPITIKASNGASTDATQSFTLTVNAPPTITSANTATFTSDVAGQTFTVTTAAGYPTATTLTETGALPSGVTFTDNHNGTATIAGTPSVATSTNYPIVIKASNGISPDASQNFTLKVTKVAAVALPTKKPKPDGKLGGVPSKIYVNQVITVTGTGYKPGAPIEIGWYYSNSTGTKLTILAHGYANAAGNFSIPVTVINNTGSKTLAAAGLGSNGKARYLLADTVVNPPLGTSTGTTTPIAGTGTGGTSTGGGTATPIAGASGSESGLANTGSRVSAASAGALALTGFALMLIGRRRRPEED